MRAEATREFRDWIDALKDLASRARIQVRIDRLLHGNAGQLQPSESAVKSQIWIAVSVYVLVTTSIIKKRLNLSRSHWKCRLRNHKSFA